ncbi:DUF3311 domain-containing protein [Tuberibacillus sp. Marseille-P3662]|uniref:DUF3311 domain-containing protein n=1 Tax=Tuberibacillus sp. Marseille-P3662 TaxID=1965358 RepID=UPI000A1C9CB5|nr:DUF3311 domain-containing protein [Tuberibacillus sp. Marseille-P3662]
MSRKRFQVLFTVVSLLTFLPLIFPIFEIVNTSTPIILGLPFNFFWVVIWIITAFILIVLLYLIDPDNKKKEED